MHCQPQKAYKEILTMEAKSLLTTAEFLTHEFLSHVMPFNTGWLDDGEGKPCKASVNGANLLYLVQVTANPVLPKVYEN